MMQQVLKEFWFEAAYQTPPYSTLHGHSFRVEVIFGGDRDPVFGWTHNPDDVEPVLESVRCELDHRYVNDIDGLSVPTLENVTCWICHRLNSRIEGLERVVGAHFLWPAEGNAARLGGQPAVACSA
jgi:6-pyruvoyltetrahydropterin/6-carboxytetrahydropterin synthase